jgi:hypothetical protein
MSAYAGVEGFLFGCDPEMFVKDAEDNLVSAVGLIPGSKDEPHKVERGTVQVDGMAAEIGIDPADNFKDFNDSIVAVMRQLKAMLPKGYGLVLEPAVRFSQLVMDAQPDTAKVLGCDPDFNAWTGEINPYPDTISDPLLRTASGHLHVGWLEGEDLMPVTDDLHVVHCRDLVKQLDWFLGSWSVKKDTDVTRRKLYGKAGAFRPKPYGAEYRVLSNFWLKDKATRMQVWNRMQAAILEMKHFEFAKVNEKENNSIIEIINEGKAEHKLFETRNYPLVRV